LANKKVPEENRPMDKPHQQLFSWDAHMVKAQNTIIHAVICIAAINKKCTYCKVI
jgi:hypothetical protein